MSLICKMHLDITLSKLQLHLWVANVISMILVYISMCQDAGEFQYDIFIMKDWHSREMCRYLTYKVLLIESTKTTSMEDVSTGVLEKIKNIQEVKIKPKMIWCIKTYIIAYAKIQKKWRYTIQYVKPTAQMVFKNRFPKGGPTCRRQVVNPRHQMSQGQSVAKPEMMDWCWFWKWLVQSFRQ